MSRVVYTCQWLETNEISEECQVAGRVWESLWLAAAFPLAIQFRAPDVFKQQCRDIPSSAVPTFPITL